jgi:hypothetical protein
MGKAARGQAQLARVARLEQAHVRLGVVQRRHRPPRLHLWVVVRLVRIKLVHVVPNARGHTSSEAVNGGPTCREVPRTTTMASTNTTAAAAAGANRAAVWVTGGGRGYGRAVAVALGQHFGGAATIVLLGRDTQSLEEAAGAVRQTGAKGASLPLSTLALPWHSCRRQP